MSNFIACDKCPQTNKVDRGRHYSLVRIDFDAGKKDSVLHSSDNDYEFHLCPECLKRFKDHLKEFLK